MPEEENKTVEVEKTNADNNVGDKKEETNASDENNTQGVANLDDKNSAQQKTEKTYTKAEINEMIKTRLSKLYNEYGVENSEALKELIGKGQSLDETQRQLEQAKSELQELKNEMLIKDNGITNKYIDLAKLYFKSKNLEVNEKNIKTLLQEFPEWNGQVQQQSPIKVGVTPTNVTPTKSTREMVEDIYGKIGG